MTDGPESDFVFGFVEPPDALTAARGRLASHVYFSRTFPVQFSSSADLGQPSRFIYRVFDDSPIDEDRSTWTVEEHIIMTSPQGRSQVRLHIAREAGNVREVVIQRVTSSKLDTLLRLDRQNSRRLLELVSLVEHVPIEGDTGFRIEEDLVRDFLADPGAMSSLYGRDKDRIRRLIESDVEADDVVAIARRREVVSRFRQLLEDNDLFEAESAKEGGPEKVWQRLLEANPWILGASLAGQLLTAWDDTKLEQVVTGYSVSAPGKRVDALLRTNGRIRAMVFAEIKHHRTSLLGNAHYRPGCWAPSGELAGGVTQIQQTVHRATREISGRLADTDADGVETGEHTYLVRPRAYLIVGHLDQLRSSTGVHRDKFESFELYRRNLYEPEIVTFDELLARAEWHCTLMDGQI